MFGEMPQQHFTNTARGTYEDGDEIWRKCGGDTGVGGLEDWTDIFERDRCVVGV